MSRSLAALLLVLAPAGPAAAYPDGPPWEAAEDVAGCTACHSDGGPLVGDSALRIVGLPQRVTPGERHRFHVRLTDPGMRRAGYLLALRAERGAAGTLAACDDRSEALAAKARSTAAGSGVEGGGGVDWCLAWQAPEAIAGTIRIILWANAANGDDSPFGDRIYRLESSIAPAAER
ncbi:MAG: hypothetical protein D6807_06050 [Alphaproteobacteria bacterium]|nr:MAG: hypothetical protein D6807_06050 [Alphaproteobacteria bacterium]